MHFIPLAVFLLLSPAAAAQSRLTDQQWIDRCTANLMDASGTHQGARAYCKCMHGMVENNEPHTQTEMERRWPPAHRDCRRRAGRK